MELYTHIIPSQIGFIRLEASEAGLRQVGFTNDPPNGSAPPKALAPAVTQLKAYFEGRLKEFDLNFDLQGTTFQKQVWQQVYTIPFGKTTTYRNIAAAMGDVRKTRAVGSANAANPVVIIIPCHRIIGMNGLLTGYIGGLERKAALLQHEGIPMQASLFGWSF
ncbi:MAG: methylated-DNA--[protein]-cysteine S-methyltransferase [Cyclonatronaceae bacterium]